MLDRPRRSKLDVPLKRFLSLVRQRPVFLSAGPVFLLKWSRSSGPCWGSTFQKLGAAARSRYCLLAVQLHIAIHQSKPRSCKAKPSLSQYGRLGHHCRVRAEDCRVRRQRKGEAWALGPDDMICWPCGLNSGAIFLGRKTHQTSKVFHESQYGG